MDTPASTAQAAALDATRNQQAPTTDTPAPTEKPAPLAAYLDTTLCPKAAEQLAAMPEDGSAPAHAGAALPAADRAALFRKAQGE